MGDGLFIVVPFAALIGGFCVGWMFRHQAVMKWRIRWIELEHDSARAGGREPREIRDVFPRG